MPISKADGLQEHVGTGSSGSGFVIIVVGAYGYAPFAIPGKELSKVVPNPNQLLMSLRDAEGIAAISRQQLVELLHGYARSSRRGRSRRHFAPPPMRDFVPRDDTTKRADTRSTPKGQNDPVQLMRLVILLQEMFGRAQKR